MQTTTETTATTYYHVTENWDGGDLLSARKRIDNGEMSDEELAAKWPEYDGYACSYDADEVHMHDTLAEAIEWCDEFCPGGQVLAVAVTDDDGDTRCAGKPVDVARGDEYDHPVIRGSVPAGAITVIA